MIHESWDGLNRGVSSSSRVRKPGLPVITDSITDYTVVYLKEYQFVSSDADMSVPDKVWNVSMFSSEILCRTSLERTFSD